VKVALLLSALVALLAPAVASGSPAIRYGIQDDAWIADGPGTLAERLDKLDAIGVQIVRYNLRWDHVAAKKPKSPASPADRAYDWTESDAILRALKARGIAALVTIYGTPRWANGGRGPNWAPKKASSIASFARAAAKRYASVQRWAIWNEPNQKRWLRPTSAAVYTMRLLNPAYAGIHAANRRALVAGGVTAPRGNAGGVSPVDWIHAMKRAGARLDAYAHNPYPLSPHTETPWAGGCAGCHTITMATLPKLLRTVEDAFGPKRIWLTEYGYQTKPPDPFGVSPGRQAAYIGQAALRAYEEPRVDMLIQYLYRDEPTLDRFQSGLLYRNSRPKPSLLAFELPFAEKSRSGSSVVVWGQLRAGPGAQPYRIEAETDGGWRTIGGTALTGAAGFFARAVRAAPGTLLRVWSPRQQLASLPLRVT
jgi:hypothetical protein